MSYEFKSVPGYLPDILTQDGLEQLMATVCLVELHDVISFASYQPTNDELLAWRLQADNVSIDDALSLYDVSAATYAARMENIYSRGRAAALLTSVLGQVRIQDGDGKVVDGLSEVFIPMLAQLIVGMQGYYTAAFKQLEEDEDAECEDEDKDEDDGQQDAEHNECIVPPKTLFQRQLLWSSSRWPGLQAEVNEKLASEDSNNEFLAFDFPQVTVTAVSPPTPPGKNCFLILAFTRISFTLNSCASESGSDALGTKVWR